PAISLQQRRDATVAITSILSGKIGDGPGERVFILAPCQMVALGAAWLIHQPACPSFAHALFLRMIYRTAPSFRAQKFPEAMSFKTSFSKPNSLTSRFSLVFSCSSSFNRLAWSTCKPPYSLRHR